MPRDDEGAARAALEAEARSGDLLERLRAADADREARADPIYPDAGDVELELREATELAKGFRSLRDAHRGELAVPRSVLPGDPRRVAAAIMLEMESDLEGLRGRHAKSRFATRRRGSRGPPILPPRRRGELLCMWSDIHRPALNGASSTFGDGRRPRGEARAELSAVDRQFPRTSRPKSVELMAGAGDHGLAASRREMRELRAVVRSLPCWLPR